MTGLIDGRPRGTAADTGEGAVLPLTPTMLGLLIVTRLTGNARQYNVILELDLDPVHPAGSLRPALAALLAVQPALRLGLHELPTPHGRLAVPPLRADVPLTTLATSSVETFEQALARSRDGIGEHDFVLAEPPLIRFTHLTGPGRSVLLVCVHHTVFDGLSIEALVADLNALLSGAVDVDRLRARRERALLRELQAQAAPASDPGAADAIARWAERLRGAVDAPLHPRPGRPVDTDFVGVRRGILLDAATSEAVDLTCRSLGITPFTFFSATFAAVVARHNGAAGAVFGTPVLSRRTMGSLDLCGLFTNTLPLVLDVDWTASFGTFATGTVAEQTAAVKRDAQVPWADIVRTLQPARESRRNPGFASMIAMQASTDVEPGRPVRGVRELGNGTAKVDLWLGVTSTGGQWLLEIETDVELLPEPVVDGIVDSLLQAITQAARNSEQPLHALFRDASRHQSTTTDGHWRQPPTGTLAGWLDHALGGSSGDGGGPSSPAAVAVEDDERHLDRHTLDALVSAAAAGLRARGVRIGDVVGLATDGLADTVVAMLGVLRAGATYLPLDPSLPADRSAYMVTAAACRLVIGSGQVPGAPSVPLAELTAEPPRGPAGRPETSGRGAPVYVMFTSGSTGRPKGVQMGDLPLLNLTAWQLAALGLGPDTRFLQYAPLGFDVSFQEIVPTLAAGGTVVSRGGCDRRDLPAIARRVQQAGITHVYLPVAALQFFARAVTEAGLGLERLRYVCVSGEQLVLDSQIRELFAARPHLTVVNLYGPTETHAVTTHVLRGMDGPHTWPAHVPIGRPITGVSTHVVDSTGHLAPVGVPGELLLGGACPADGYVGDADQTAARFVPDPYTGPGAGRAVRYRSGDRVIWDVTGELIFLGREDDQVKIRGYRVELSEVEAAAVEVAGVRHAVAVATGDGADRHLLLFVVPDGDPDALRAPQLADVRRALADALPGYMTPRDVFAVDAVPKTANGKIARHALLARVADLPSARGAIPSATEAPPLTDSTLRWLERTWAAHLGQDRIDPDTSLFDLGAHSLMVLSVITAIEQEHGADVPMLEFFRRPTLRYLAGVIDRTAR
jgi:amino acid adenylation domain-containing protein